MDVGVIFIKLLFKPQSGGNLNYFQTVLQIMRTLFIARFYFLILM